MSNKKSFLGKAAFPVTMPARVLVNKGIRRDFSMYQDAFKSQNKSIICPTCNEGRLHVLYESENDTTWGCSSCGFQVETITSDIKELRVLVEQHGRDWYLQGQEEGLNSITDFEKQEGVKRLVTHSRIFLFLSVIAYLFVPLFIKWGAGLSSFNMLLVAVFLTLNGISISYKAFKLHNNLLYTKNQKGVFWKWFKECRFGYYPQTIPAKEVEDA